MKRVEHRQDYRDADEALPQGWRIHEIMGIRHTPATCNQRWELGN